MNDDQVFIFTGPTISPQIAQQHLDAIYLPPVKLGDVYRISELYSPRIIGIIDGYFNQVPAVWHKEILQALSQGIAVYGAASMGALRAAELDQLGMTGCGKIYRAYQSGLLPPFNDEAFEDDDEVAVIHSPAELGYLAASDAMVNIRFSLAKAEQQGVIDRATCRNLAGIAKTQFYADRNYASILQIAKQHALPETQLAALAKWLGQHSIDQKQLDAIELLKQIKQDQHKPPETPAAAQLPFQHTSQWQVAIDEIERSHHQENSVLNELRLKGREYFQTLDKALRPPRPLKPRQSEDKYTDLTLHHRKPEKLEQIFSQNWLHKLAGTTPHKIPPMLGDQLLLDYLRQTGALESLKIRARDKKSDLKRLQPKPDSTTLSEIDRLQLCDWYFSARLDREMPDQLEDYVAQLGLEDSDSFYDMILGEYIYLNSEN